MILGNWVLSRAAVKQRRADTLVDLYAEFLAAFQHALHLTEKHLTVLGYGDAFQANYPDDHEPPNVRSEAEKRFRETAWRLWLREGDPLQKKKIEERNIQSNYFLQ